MIKTITVVPRICIEDMIKYKQKPFENWALISLWSEKELLTQSNTEVLKELSCKNMISIRFTDLTKDEYDRVKDEYERTKKSRKNIILFEQQHARTIIDFIDEIKNNVDELVVHCHAGISRSGAVGLFICRYLQLDENEFRQLNAGIGPNFYILSVLNEESGINVGYVEFWKNHKKEEIERMRQMMMKNQFQIF